MSLKYLSKENKDIRHMLISKQQTFLLELGDFVPIFLDIDLLKLSRLIF